MRLRPADALVVRAARDGTADTCRLTPRFVELRNYAYTVIFIYAVVLPLFFFLVLYSQRIALLNGTSTPITRAMEVVHAEYKARAGRALCQSLAVPPRPVRSAL